VDECKPLPAGRLLRRAVIHHQAAGLGRAVQVDPINPALKGAGTKRLKVKCDILLSTFPFHFDLRRYSWADVDLPVFGPVHRLSIPSVIAAAATVGVWVGASYHGATWAWILQDIMGMSFLVNVLRLVHLPNLKVGLNQP
jgi:hypothetical protein